MDDDAGRLAGSMAPHPRTPRPLLGRPFTTAEALRLGVTSDMLNGSSWIRLHPRVWVHREHEMTHLDRIAAAAMAMPDRAQLSHVSRLQSLGLDVGDHLPIHFTVSGDLHIAIDDIFLHRTEVLPPLTVGGVSPASAFVQYCATATVLEAIVAGDWLLAGRHMTIIEVAELAMRDDWRPGARQARAVLHHLDQRSRSPKESELRSVVVFSGLPVPEVNADVFSGGRRVAIVDLLLQAWRLVLEYEGRQHAFDTKQFARDITRYADLREAGHEYVQVTSEMLAQPRALALTIHRALVRRGYGGPAPLFGRRWTSLFEPIRARPHLSAVR